MCSCPTYFPVINVQESLICSGSGFSLPIRCQSRQRRLLSTTSLLPSLHVFLFTLQTETSSSCSTTFPYLSQIASSVGDPPSFCTEATNGPLWHGRLAFLPPLERNSFCKAGLGPVWYFLWANKSTNQCCEEWLRLEYDLWSAPMCAHDLCPD